MNHQAERDRRAKAYSYRAYRRRVQQAQAMAQRGQQAVVAAGVSMAGCSGSWFQTISISATSANKKNRYTVVTISCFFIGSLPPE